MASISGNQIREIRGGVNRLWKWGAQIFGAGIQVGTSGTLLHLVQTGSYTTVADDGTSTAIDAPGVLDGDFVFAVAAEGTATVRQSGAAKDTINVVFNKDPATDTVVKWMVVRA